MASCTFRVSPSLFWRMALLVVLLALAACGQTPQSAPGPSGDAPGAPGLQAHWTTGRKMGVGTSQTLESKVWFTLAEGVLTEVYYPALDNPNVETLEFLVSDGKTVEEERLDTTAAITLPNTKSLDYQITTTARSGRYRFTKTYLTDPAHNTLAIHVTFTPLQGPASGYHVYLYYDPSINGNALGDTGSVAMNHGKTVLLAADPHGPYGPVTSALGASVGFRRVSNGFVGASDGREDLKQHLTMKWSFAKASGGNIAQIAELDLSHTSTFDIGLAFGKDSPASRSELEATLSTPFATLQQRYDQGWQQYLASLAPLHESRWQGALDTPVGDRLTLRDEYYISAMTLKASEDKTARGAMIASTTIPWGQAQQANEGRGGGYHLVWARDLYQEATALLAAGDRQTANEALDYLFRVQQRPDGSMPQNTYLDGTPVFPSLQMDEVAFPIVLAWQLGRNDSDTYHRHIKSAADFILKLGPTTPQERWEENGGYSPATIAAEICGLITAANIARHNGDSSAAGQYEATADKWQRNLSRWTAVPSGPLSKAPYFLRISDTATPTDGGSLTITNGGGAHNKNEVVDSGFLELVRLGILSPQDPLIGSSLQVVDAQLRVDTTSGPAWRRYNFDGYGEQADGSPYQGQGVGRLWPLLDGERGEYLLAKGDTKGALYYLTVMKKFAFGAGMIPEQVWDQGDVPAQPKQSPESASIGFKSGLATGSAAPLHWSMAQYLRLFCDIDSGKLLEQPSLTFDRYGAHSR